MYMPSFVLVIDAYKYDILRPCDSSNRSYDCMLLDKIAY